MMQKEFAQLMQERFGCDKLISLATCVENLPSVRTVNAYYLDGCFYVITYALSGKIQQIKQNPRSLPQRTVSASKLPLYPLIGSPRSIL